MVWRGLSPTKLWRRFANIFLFIVLTFNFIGFDEGIFWTNQGVLVRVAYGVCVSSHDCSRACFGFPIVVNVNPVQGVN